MKFVIMGSGYHGKGTVCEVLKSYFGLKSSSSSFVARHLVYAASELLKSKYPNADTAHDNRRTDRIEWYQQIQAINADDKSTLARMVFASGNDIYDGMRDREELRAAKRGFNDLLTVWVHNPTVKDEDRGSCTVTAADCDFTIMNAGSLPELQRKVIGIFSMFEGVP